MIERNEILQKSSEFEIHTSHVQRDYLFGWVLVGIYTISDLKNYLILKGGNCFRKAYFENTRFSRDLDFSTKTQLKPEYLQSELNKVCDFVYENCGVVFEKNRNRVEKKKRVDPGKLVYEARLYFRDFFGDNSKIVISIRLDVSQYEKIYLPIQTRNLIHPYSDEFDCRAEINCLKLEEMMAIKLKCLLQRRHSFDLYDYVFSLILNENIEINKADVVKAFLKMTIFERSPGFVKGLFVDLPLYIFKAVWNKYIITPKHNLISFDKATNSFKENVFELFGGFPEPVGTVPFFPAELRNPIMEAGYTNTLLELEYDNVVRLVEPYALSYKRRKDGVAREYFYAYDQTGGKSSEPGIKTFLPHKIQSLKNTDINFEPRYDIELSKAGEYPQKGYFGKPFSSRRKTGGRKSPTTSFPKKIRKPSFGYHSGPTYIIQCPVCYKTFRRKKDDTKLNKHKDKYGNRCFGKVGFLIDVKY